MKVAAAWQSPPATLELSADELHLWKIDLSTAELPGILNQQEQQRVDRLIVAEKKQQFSQARNALRHILSRYLNEHPAELVFEYGAEGKPYLKVGRVHFNLSHSNNWAVLAVTSAGPVGVDLEHTGKSISRQALVERFFNPEEKRSFAAASVARRNRQFFRLWTRKESLLKLSGLGWQGVKTQPVEDIVSRHFLVAKNYLSCASFPSSITSIIKLKYL